MKKTIAKGVITLLLIALSGCYTLTGPDYVSFQTKGAKTSKQKTYRSSPGKPVSSYDDEFVYDAAGNVMEHIQVEYWNEGEYFCEYHVYYQKIGQYILPKSIEINGVEFMAVEYDLMATTHKGFIEEYTSSPSFEEVIQIGFFFPRTETTKWVIDIDKFDVPFIRDDKFVTNEAKVGIFGGLSMDKALTLGYDNVVLSKFYYSREKLQKGFRLSYNRDSEEELTFDEDEVEKTSFEFVWDVIGGKLVQTKMNFKSVEGHKFTTERQFDQYGRRVREEWIYEHESEDPISIFIQELTY